MPINEILDEAGIRHAETLFLQPPDAVHAVWHDDITAEGSDFGNETYRHRYTVELCEPYAAQSPEAHEALRDVLDANGIHWVKKLRIFYTDLQYFVTTYEFEFLERRG